MGGARRSQHGREISATVRSADGLISTISPANYRIFWYTCQSTPGRGTITRGTIDSRRIINKERMKIIHRVRSGFSKKRVEIRGETYAQRAKRSKRR
jgi:hypothetical protein